MKEIVISQVLDYTRLAVLEQIKELIASKRAVPGAYDDLYELISDYPFRKGKALRPALCICTARAVGGLAQGAMVSSAALEMFHNAALIHDDLEDESDLRRGEEAMHHMVGIGRAVNLGDATQVLSLSFLLENLNTIGVAKSMHVMHEIENMSRQSVEGQAMELDWIANHVFDLGDDDYYRMCTKKTCWYTFIAPCRIGYIVGTNNWNDEEVKSHLDQLTEFGMVLGIAFQVQDDLLNLIGSEEQYGKEIGGDIYEGKRTIMLNHVIEHSESSEQIKAIIRKPRVEKTVEEIAFILNEMNAIGSIEYGKKIAEEYADKANKILEEMTFLKEQEIPRNEEKWDVEVADRRLIQELVNYVVERDV